MSTTLTYIAESPGAMCSILASYFLSWIQQAVGTLQAISPPTWQLATLPYTCTVSYGWTDPSSTVQEDTIVILLAFLARPAFGSASTVVAPQYLVQSAGSSSRMVVDGSQPGLAGVDRSDLVTLWIAATSAIVVSALEDLSHVVPIDAGQSYSSDDMTYNIWRQFAVQNFIFGGQIETFQWALQVINAGNGTLVTAGLADESTVNGQQMTTGGAEQQTADALTQIATMEPVISFNHGQTVVSVQSGVNS